MKLPDLQLLIAEGEGLTLEFKEKYTSKIDKGIVAMANSKGGYIILGVNDSGKIIGEKLTNQMKAEILSLARNCEPHINIPKISQVEGVVVIEVPEGDEKPYSCSSGYFRRLDAATQKLTQKEVRTMFRETADKLFEALPRKDCSLSALSMKKIDDFLHESKTEFRVNKQNLVSFLSSIGVTDKTAQKTTEKTTEKILIALRENPAMSATELAKKLGISYHTIDWNFRKLRKMQRIRHVGPDKGGYWEIVKGEGGV